jgi:site-specific DNA-methyltransferase (adenine-specific)
LFDIKNCNCIDGLKEMKSESVDLTVTSPPYDNMRKYEKNAEWNFEIFQNIAKELYRVTKKGGVVVWVVSDATIKGSETGTSFKQALFFKETGFNLHDTMIWQKTGMLPTQDRYYNIFEYMFVFGKGKPKTMNFICDHKTTAGGRVQKRDSCINKGQQKDGNGTFIRNKYARRTNIWRIPIGKNKETEGHPAPFPEQLASDHIITWSNPGDLVLDPFAGSGTTGKMAVINNRDFIGFEISQKYYNTAEKRLNNIYK